MFLIDDDYLYVIKWRLDIIINELQNCLICPPHERCREFILFCYVRYRPLFD